MRSVEQRGRPGCAKVGVRTVKPPKVGAQGQPRALEHSFAWRLPFPGRPLPPALGCPFPISCLLVSSGVPRTQRRSKIINKHLLN